MYFFLVNSLLLGDRFRIQERIDDIAIAVAVWKWISLIFYKCTSRGNKVISFLFHDAVVFVVCFTLLHFISIILLWVVWLLTTGIEKLQIVSIGQLKSKVHYKLHVYNTYLHIYSSSVLLFVMYVTTS